MMMMKAAVVFVVVFVTGLLIFTVTRPFFLEFAGTYKLAGGFIKFFFLASVGDFIGLRLRTKVWQVPKGMFFKAVVWGIIGVVIVMMFVVYPEGVATLQANHILPFEGNEFAIK